MPKKINQFAEKSAAVKKRHAGPRAEIQAICTPKVSKSSSQRCVERNVVCESYTGVHLPRLAVAQTHPNPRRSVPPFNVDRAWELPSEHKRQIVVSRSTFTPPTPFPHHHLLLLPPRKNIVFSLIFPHRNTWPAPRYKTSSLSISS
jgi:hypothetical protein